MSTRLRPNVSQMNKETRAYYRRSCESKNGYPTPACALLHCLDMRGQNEDLWAYGPCQFCGMYHVGHATGKLRRENVMQCIESLLTLNVESYQFIN